MEQEIIAKISETLHIKQEELTSETLLRNVIEDSMDLFELLTILENEYDVRIEPERLAGVETIGDIARYVAENKGSTGGEESLKSF